MLNVRPTAILDFLDGRTKRRLMMKPDELISMKYAIDTLIATQNDCVPQNYSDTEMSRARNKQEFLSIDFRESS
jgi:hypothetical protein